MTAARIPLWVDLRGVPVNKRLPFWKAVRDVDAERVLLGTDDPHLDKEGTLRLDGHHALKDGKKALGRLVRLRGAKDQERAAKAKGIVLVDSDDWKVIPLENLIAARRDRPGTLFAVAHDVAQVRLFRDTLQIGVHGIVLAPRTVQDLEDAHRFLVERGPRDDDALPAAPQESSGKTRKPTGRQGKTSGRQGAQDGTAQDGARATTARGKDDASADEERPDGSFLVPATVTAIEDAGPGDRVCIDTTSVFRPGEGLLVGSTARSFLLVHAETLESEYVRPRPFRVNAGAVHSYLFAPEGKTLYLSELRSGMPVLAVHPDGIHRVLVIGRAKLERRPHCIVRWENDGLTGPGREGSAVLQTAETIRLVREDGTAVSVTDLRPGDRVLVHNEHAARHFGMAVEESLEER